jgi:hypothetical protein
VKDAILSSGEVKCCPLLGEEGSEAGEALLSERVPGLPSPRTLCDLSLRERWKKPTFLRGDVEMPLSLEESAAKRVRCF